MRENQEKQSPSFIIELPDSDISSEEEPLYDDVYVGVDVGVEEGELQLPLVESTEELSNEAIASKLVFVLASLASSLATVESVRYILKNSGALKPENDPDLILIYIVPFMILGSVLWIMLPILKFCPRGAPQNSSTSPSTYNPQNFFHHEIDKSNCEDRFDEIKKQPSERYPEQAEEQKNPEEYRWQCK